MNSNSPTHEEISRRAQQLWQQHGRPDGRDTEFWLEAEQQLASKKGAKAPASDGAERERTRTVSESKGAAALAERVTEETAAESAVEFHISPPVPEAEAVKAALQKKEARAPKIPAKTAPKPPTPTSGKPLWDKPHSS